MIWFRIACSIVLIAALCNPPAGEAQPAAKVVRIGWLGDDPATTQFREAFRRGLRDLGYVEGRDLVIEYRFAEGKLERFPAVATELVALKVDVIVAVNVLAALAAKRVTKTIPILFASVSDPIESGLVTSLARPGGNATGVSNISSELVAKGLELLKEALPGKSRIAVLWQPGGRDEATQKDRVDRAAVAARALRVRLELVEAREPADIDRAFSEITRTRADALSVLGGVMFFNERTRLVALAAKNRVPTMYPARAFVDAGGLMAYSANFADQYQRLAAYVDKIVKGAAPADLPVEQPTKFELIINLKAAKALGLTIPPSLLARADHVVEK